MMASAIESALEPATNQSTNTQSDVVDPNNRIARIEHSVPIWAQEQFTTCVANALYDLAKMLLKAIVKRSGEDYDPDEDRSVDRIIQTSQTVSEEQLQDFNVPVKYLRLLRLFPSIIHKISRCGTGGEFARFLLEHYRNKKIFFLWEDIFPIIYGGDIVEVEERDEGPWTMLLHGFPEEEVGT